MRLSEDIRFRYKEFVLDDGCKVQLDFEEQHVYVSDEKVDRFKLYSGLKDFWYHDKQAFLYPFPLAADRITIESVDLDHLYKAEIYEKHIETISGWAIYYGETHDA